MYSLIKIWQILKYINYGKMEIQLEYSNLKVKE